MAKKVFGGSVRCQNRKKKINEERCHKKKRRKRKKKVSSFEKRLGCIYRRSFLSVKRHTLVRYFTPSVVVGTIEKDAPSIDVAPPIAALRNTIDRFSLLLWDFCFKKKGKKGALPEWSEGWFLIGFTILLSSLGAFTLVTIYSLLIVHQAV